MKLSSEWASQGMNRLSFSSANRKVDVRLLGKGNSNSHGARPDHLITTMIKWIRTSRLSIMNSLSVGGWQFQEISHAYSVLSDPGKRDKYDQ